jgi:putative FmdB family regulatory protein
LRRRRRAAIIRTAHTRLKGEALPRVACTRTSETSETVPTYDYQCRDCGHTIEVIHGMQEQGPTTCERCSGPLRRVLFPAGIIFKGAGFYKTDSRSSGSTESGSGTKTKPDSAAATKPATKTSTEGGGTTPPAPAAPATD